MLLNGTLGVAELPVAILPWIDTLGKILGRWWEGHSSTPFSISLTFCLNSSDATLMDRAGCLLPYVLLSQSAADVSSIWSGMMLTRT